MTNLEIDNSGVDPTIVRAVVGAGVLHPHRRGFDKKNVLRAFKAVVRTANETKATGEPDRIPAGMRFHDRRHTVASILLSAGQSLLAVSRRLGHARPEMSLRVYAHCMPMDDERLAAELERMLTSPRPANHVTGKQVPIAWRPVSGRGRRWTDRPAGASG